MLAFYRGECRKKWTEQRPNRSTEPWPRWLLSKVPAEFPPPRRWCRLQRHNRMLRIYLVITMYTQATWACGYCVCGEQFRWKCRKTTRHWRYRWRRTPPSPGLAFSQRYRSNIMLASWWNIISLLPGLVFSQSFAFQNCNFKFVITSFCHWKFWYIGMLWWVGIQNTHHDSRTQQ